MPELPEVETTARILAPELLARTVVAVQAIDYPPLVAPLAPEEFAHRLAGRRITALGRRAKFLLLHLDDGAVLAVHLRMSGRLYLSPREAPSERHTHAVLELDDGRALRFRDPRKFGRMRLMSPEEYGALDRQLGPEPLSAQWNAAALAKQLQGRPRARLKALLLDQHFLAGLGNIYSDEALFRAGLHPARPAGSLSPGEVERLHEAIRAVLAEAIDANGTTLSDGIFLFGSGEAGRFAERLQVYGRAGKPCPRCGRAIVRELLAGRGSHFCPHCQR